MAEQRRGLGRGLSALLSEVESAPAVAPGAATPAGVREIPIEQIAANPDQPRRTFPEGQLDELAASLREKGVLQPILVRPTFGQDSAYQIVAGERRWRAAQRAGLKAVPALVRELDDLAVLEIAIVENVQRSDLTPLDEAEAYRALMERFGRTQEAVAQTVGKSRSHVANTLRLLSLPESVRDLLSEGRIDAGHARAVASAVDPAALAQLIADKGLSVREAEALARKPLDDGAKPKGRRKDIDTRDLESSLEDALGLKVEIRHKGEGGEMRLGYASLEQLDELCERLLRRVARPVSN